MKVRIIAATNCDLGLAVEEGKFREDLYYRVNVLQIVLAPLRDRPGDVDLLIDHFLPEPWHVDPAARAALNQHSWPGNVRELINVTQRATILADGNDITLDDLPAEFSHLGEAHEQDASGEGTRSRGSESGTSASVCDRLDDVAKSHVLEVLKRENGNKAKTARVLGIHRRKLYRLLERFEQAESSESSNESSLDEC